MGDKKEYIERGALVKTPPFTKYGGDSSEYAEGYLDCAEDARKAVNDAPAADVVEVRHGEWIKTTEPLGAHDVDCVECSACGESWILDGDFDFDVVKDFWNYCPNCGAKMDGERKKQT